MGRHHHHLRCLSNSSKRSSSSLSSVSDSKLSLGFFKRLITPDEEEAFVDGCRELSLGDENKAFEHLHLATHLADGAWLAGFLALVEVYQQQSNWQKAIDCLQQLRNMEPDDVVVKLSLAELLLAASPDDKNTCKKIIGFSQNIENETSIHAVLLLYKARALRTLGLAEAAKQVLTIALRRKKGRSDDLLHALRYERALAYEQMGQHGRVRSDLEHIYAEYPDCLDVAVRPSL